MTEILKPDKSGEKKKVAVGNMAKRKSVCTYGGGGNGCWSEKGRESVNGVRLSTSYGIEAHFSEKGFFAIQFGQNSAEIRHQDLSLLGLGSQQQQQLRQLREEEEDK